MGYYKDEEELDLGPVGNVIYKVVGWALLIMMYSVIWGIPVIVLVGWLSEWFNS